MTLSDELFSLLETERRAVKEGRFNDLAALGDDKERLLRHLAATEHNDAVLARLKDRMERNNSLLEAAQRGLGAALTQIGIAREAASPQTYGPKGERDSLGPNARRVEKRC